MVETTRAELKSGSKIQVVIEGVAGLRTMSLPHGYKIYTTPIRQVMKSLLCPEHLNCQWCNDVVERARSLATADVEIFY